MKNLKLFLIVLSLILAFSSTSFGDNSTRTANIIDASGLKTEVKDLKVIGGNLNSQFPYNYYEIYTQSNAITISLKNLVIAVPFESIKTLKVAEQNAEVVYKWLGQDRTITGSFANVNISGESDFGNITLLMNKIREIVFKDLPSTEFDAETQIKYEEKKARDVATVFLSDGTKYKVCDLGRNSSYYHHGTAFESFRNLTFKRGDSLLKVDYLKIQTVDFGPEKTVTVTLTNGNSATGMISDEDNAQILGWNGIVSDYGWIYIKQELVKKIVFENPKS